MLKLTKDLRKGAVQAIVDLKSWGLSSQEIRTENIKIQDLSALFAEAGFSVDELTELPSEKSEIKGPSSLNHEKQDSQNDASSPQTMAHAELLERKTSSTSVEQNSTSNKSQRKRPMTSSDSSQTYPASKRQLLHSTSHLIIDVSDTESEPDIQGQILLKKSKESTPAKEAELKAKENEIKLMQDLITKRMESRRKTAEISDVQQLIDDVTIQKVALRGAQKRDTGRELMSLSSPRLQVDLDGRTSNEVLGESEDFSDRRHNLEIMSHQLEQEERKHQVAEQVAGRKSCVELSTVSGKRSSEEDDGTKIKNGVSLEFQLRAKSDISLGSPNIMVPPPGSEIHPSVTGIMEIQRASSTVATKIATYSSNLRETTDKNTVIGSSIQDKLPRPQNGVKMLSVILANQSRDSSLCRTPAHSSIFIILSIILSFRLGFRMVSARGPFFTR